MDQLTILTITHRHGVNIWPCRTRRLAKQILAEWVRQWWHQELPGTPMPQGKNEMIETYFESIEEQYDIQSSPIYSKMPSMV